MPFQSTRVWFELAPRMKSEDALPGEPLRATSTPGTVRSRSATEVSWRCSISSRSMTVTVAGTSPSSSSSRVAVTTIDSSYSAGGVGWGCLGLGVEARTGITPPRMPTANRMARMERAPFVRATRRDPWARGGAAGGRAAEALRRRPGLSVPTPRGIFRASDGGQVSWLPALLLPGLPTRSTARRAIAPRSGVVPVSTPVTVAGAALVSHQLPYRHTVVRLSRSPGGHASGVGVASRRIPRRSTACATGSDPGSGSARRSAASPAG